MGGASGVVEVVMVVVVVGVVYVCICEREIGWLFDWLIDWGDRKERGNAWVLKLQP